MKHLTDEHISVDISLVMALTEENQRLREQLTEKNSLSAPKKDNKVLEPQDLIYKSNGVKKAQSSDPIRSYSEFKAIQDYFLGRQQLRNYLMWTMGVAMGLRISDLIRIKFSCLIDDNGNFRERVKIQEQKTSKVNNILITEVVVEAMRRYLDSINYQYNLDDYIFKSRKGNNSITKYQGWRIINDAGTKVGLSCHLGSHSMRKSFVNIALCVDKQQIDTMSLVKAQGLLNHSDLKTTMRYLNTLTDMYDRARIAVSDFLLGKTDTDELVAGRMASVDEIYEKLENIAQKLEGGT